MSGIVAIQLEYKLTNYLRGLGTATNPLELAEKIGQLITTETLSMATSGSVYTIARELNFSFEDKYKTTTPSLSQVFDDYTAKANTIENVRRSIDENLERLEHLTPSIVMLSKRIAGEKLDKLLEARGVQGEEAELAKHNIWKNFNQL